MRYRMRLLCMVAPVVLMGAGAATIELRLPADIVFSKTVGADGAVLFRHSTHVAYEGVRCTGCHPSPFKLLTPVKQTSHEEMNAGRSCGTCHNGGAAFATSNEETCARCHTAWGSTRASYPPDVSLRTSASSPGPVQFRHATHGERTSSCADCHPRPFIPKMGRQKAPQPGFSGIPAHDTCGVCHEGDSAFIIEDDASCPRCHQFKGDGS